MPTKCGDAFLRCQVRPGMFSDERLVTVRRADGDTESFFVPESVVNETRSVVRVHVHGKAAGPSAGIVASLLTGEGDAFVTVKPDDLESRSRRAGSCSRRPVGTSRFPFRRTGVPLNACVT